MRQNRYAVTPELPAIPGTEVAGPIERLGDGVGDLTVGTPSRFRYLRRARRLAVMWHPRLSYI
jgi:D-arabinose 1-dehydrogenase-like Zn-dependent alcohol dehydrogenase